MALSFPFLLTVGLKLRLVDRGRTSHVQFSIDFEFEAKSDHAISNFTIVRLQSRVTDRENSMAGTFATLSL